MPRRQQQVGKSRGTCAYVATTHLQLISSLGVPNLRGLVGGSGQNSRSLWVEASFRNLAVVACQDGVACASHCVKYSSVAVSRGGDQLASGAVEAHV